MECTKETRECKDKPATVRITAELESCTSILNTQTKHSSKRLTSCFYASSSRIFHLRVCFPQDHPDVLVAGCIFQTTFQSQCVILQLLLIYNLLLRRWHCWETCFSERGSEHPIFKFTAYQRIFPVSLCMWWMCTNTQATCQTKTKADKGGWNVCMGNRKTASGADRPLNLQLGTGETDDQRKKKKCWLGYKQYAHQEVHWSLSVPLSLRLRGSEVPTCFRQWWCWLGGVGWHHLRACACVHLYLYYWSSHAQSMFE